MLNEQLRMKSGKDMIKYYNLIFRREIRQAIIQKEGKVGHKERFNPRFYLAVQEHDVNLRL